MPTQPLLRVTTPQLKPSFTSPLQTFFLAPSRDLDRGQPPVGDPSTDLSLAALTSHFGGHGDTYPPPSLCPSLCPSLYPSLCPSLCTCRH
eukprot:CAMPEP_0173064626 /NCGR_PEP_ID=MMETSP1102-20130122/5110_1 /TAXON_ID=49646 /ORGANISM="Geminigera sp., Strain Caron Lab Isolate" /LENGTH=89 /DNA_ID=CAMNT_0013931693 /DNA_START=1103 /DNA_END=1372 /DNA_ORIENTATION=+